MKADYKTKTQKSVINGFSVDVEGFVESNVQSFNIPDKYINQSEENREIEQNIEVLLEILDEVGVKGTFFFVGRLARDIPAVVRKVAFAGHEIGCHNYLHLRVFDTERDEFTEKVAAAKKDLEDVSGRPVYGFRAPDFSITQESIWALDVLREAGFVYDSSIYPFGLHDVYGIKNAETGINKLPNGLIEVPMSTIEFLGKRIPFGGGGYFRLYPLWLTRLFIGMLNKRGTACISYIHPYEVGPVIPKVSELSAYRRFRHYYHCKNGSKRLGKLLKACRFSSIIDVLKEGGFVGGNMFSS